MDLTANDEGYFTSISNLLYDMRDNIDDTKYLDNIQRLQCIKKKYKKMYEWNNTFGAKIRDILLYFILIILIFNGLILLMVTSVNFGIISNILYTICIGSLFVYIGFIVSIYACTYDEFDL